MKTSKSLATSKKPVKKPGPKVEFTVNSSKWFGGQHKHMVKSPWEKGDELYEVRNMIPQATRDDVKSVLLTYSKVLGDKHDIFVAGGFLRDAVCGRKPKDVDLFIITDDGDEVRKILEGFSSKKKTKKKASVSFSKWNYKGGSQYAHMKTPEGFEPVLATGAMVMENLPEINVVIYKRGVIANMREALTAFDFGLCQIGAFQGRALMGESMSTVTYLGTEAFIEDVAFKKCTVVSDHSPVRSANRFKKSIAPRYPDFTFVK